MTASSIPAAPELWMRSSSSATKASPPSRENRFCPHILRVQVTLEAFRRGELPENIAALFRREPAGEAARLELVLQPQPLVRVGYMRELGADRAAVDELQLAEDVPQLLPFRQPRRCGCP